jgi:hypothetical protein
MNQVSIRMKEISELYSQLHFVSQKSSDVKNNINKKFISYTKII